MPTTRPHHAQSTRPSFPDGRFRFSTGMKLSPILVGAVMMIVSLVLAVVLALIDRKS